MTRERPGTKGVFSSIVVLLAFLSALFVATAFSFDIQRNFDVVNMNAVNDRVFYKFAAIEHSVLRILEKDLTNNSFDVKIVEGKFNLVTLNMSIPAGASNFSRDLTNFEMFAETKLNESRLVVDLNLSAVSGCLPLTILPYNITYGTFDQSSGNCGFGTGQRDLKIVPYGSAPSFLNGHDMLVVASKTRVDAASASWTPPGDCTGGTLNWTVRVVGNTTSYGPVTNMIDKDGKCGFRINEDTTGNKIIQIDNKPGNDDPDATMVLAVQPGFNVTFQTTLNLTDTPDKIRVGLLPQSIKIRETLFQVERNDTAVIQ